VFALIIFRGLASYGTLSLYRASSVAVASAAAGQRLCSLHKCRMETINTHKLQRVHCSNSFRFQGHGLSEEAPPLHAKRSGVPPSLISFMVTARGNESIISSTTSTANVQFSSLPNSLECQCNFVSNTHYFSRCQHWLSSWWTAQLQSSCESHMSSSRQLHCNSYQLH
jgi:hypothetical protein